MKKFRLSNLILLLFFLTILLFSCKKDDSDSFSIHFTAKFNNVSYVATSVTTNINYTWIVISGAKGSESLGIFVPQDATTGTYDCNWIGDYCILYTSATGNYSIESGSVTITKNDVAGKILSGTFNCILTKISLPADTLNVTQGSFSVKY